MEPRPTNQTEHTRATLDAYDRLAPVWSEATDAGPFNGHLERPALRSLVPVPLTGQRVLDAGCGAGAQCAWLLDEGADVIGTDVSAAMVEEARRRCGGRGLFFVADLAGPLELDPGSLDGITCSLVLHYLEDWAVPLRSFARALRPGGWVVLSLDHPFGLPLPGQSGGYFDTELLSQHWEKAGVEVTQFFWRRPLGAVVRQFAAAGFVMEDVAEARPSSEALMRFPHELAVVADVPSFIAYRLRLAAPPLP